MMLHFLILQRYVLRRQVGPFLFSLFVITLLFLLNLAFRILGRFLSKGLEFSVIIEFFILNLAWIIALTVPMAVLTANLMAFGSLAADNEITAIKASGISLYRIIGFSIITATVLAIFLIWFNNAVLPNFNHRARMLGADINAKRPTLKLEPGVLLQQDQFNIIVTKILEEKKNYSLVSNITIFFNEDNQHNKTIVAQKAEIVVDEANSRLQIKLFDGELHEVDWNSMGNYNILKFPKHVITIPVPGLRLTRRDDEYFSDREKSAAIMQKEVVENQSRILIRNTNINNIVIPEIEKHLSLSEIKFQSDLGKKIEFRQPPGNKIDSKINFRKPKISIQQITPQIATRNLIPDYEALLRLVRSEKNIIHNFDRSNYVLLVEIHKKYSIPIACIVFVLVGAPLGIIARRGNMAASGGIGLFFFILYWAFLIAGEELADRQIVSPAVAMWSPNILVGAFGIYLVFSVVKETKYFRFNFSAFKSLFTKWLPNLNHRNDHANS